MSRWWGGRRGPPGGGERIIQEAWRRILAGYIQARQQQPFPGEIRPLFDEAAKGLAALPSARARPAINVRGGFGLGEWSPTPWLCLMNPRAGVAPYEGVHVGLTFRQDMAGFHVVLAHGRKRDLRILGRPRAREKWARIAAEIRAGAGHLAAA